MQDLTLVGVQEDGEHLVLTDVDGQRFRLRVDESLRGAVRRDHARPHQLQAESEGLRPREIQARIRAGQTAEEIAEAAGVPVEHVRRFEGPVLAEREFVAGQARGVRLRRSASTITSHTLGELVQQRLGQREDDADTEWSAWREDDGTWVVCLSFQTGTTRRRAHWTYDTQLRHVAARDEEARWFTEEERTDISTPAQRRLTTIRDLREQRDPGRDQRDPDRDTGSARMNEPGGRRTTEDRYLEEYPPERHHRDRYENARYGEDRFREDLYRDEVYGEDHPAEVRRATIDLLDTLRERRGRRQHLTPTDPVTITPDAVDAAVETLRTRADALGDPPGPPPDQHRDDSAADPDPVPLPADDVIELPEEEPVRRRPPAGSATPPRATRSTTTDRNSTTTDRNSTTTDRNSTAADRNQANRRNTSDRGTPDRAAATERSATGRSAGGRSAADRSAPGGRSGADRAGEATGSASRPAGSRPTTGRPAAAGKRPAARDDDGSRPPGPPGGTTRSGVPATGDPGTGSSSGARGTKDRGPGGRRTQVSGYPSPTAPPGSPPAPARDRQTTAPVEEAPAERTTRRNKRASVPSWDDIVFGSRRE